jgi:hypothetical protein
MAIPAAVIPISHPLILGCQKLLVLWHVRRFYFVQNRKVKTLSGSSVRARVRSDPIRDVAPLLTLP